MEDKCKTGRVTIPTDLDVVPETLEILKKWGADVSEFNGFDFGGKNFRRMHFKFPIGVIG